MERRERDIENQNWSKLHEHVQTRLDRGESWENILRLVDPGQQVTTTGTAYPAPSDPRLTHSTSWNMPTIPVANHDTAPAVAQLVLHQSPAPHVQSYNQYSPTVSAPQTTGDDTTWNMQPSLAANQDTFEYPTLATAPSILSNTLPQFHSNYAAVDSYQGFAASYPQNIDPRMLTIQPGQQSTPFPGNHGYPNSGTPGWPNQYYQPS